MTNNNITDLGLQAKTLYHYKNSKKINKGKGFNCMCIQIVQKRFVGEKRDCKENILFLRKLFNFYRLDN
jgi:hypothetical protein